MARWKQPTSTDRAMVSKRESKHVDFEGEVRSEIRGRVVRAAKGHCKDFDAKRACGRRLFAVYVQFAARRLAHRPDPSQSALPRSRGCTTNELERATAYQAAGRGNQVSGDFHDVWQTDAYAFRLTPATGSKIPD